MAVYSGYPNVTRGGGFVPTGTLGYPREGAKNIPSSGKLMISDFYSSEAVHTVTVSSLHRRTLSLSEVYNGWDGRRKLKVIFDGGCILSGDVYRSAALGIGDNYPNGLVIVNYGWIIGTGGSGGHIDSQGEHGGSAIAAFNQVNSKIEIFNYGQILGGGGGGGAGASWSWNGLNRSTPGSGGASGYDPAPGGINGPNTNGAPAMDTNGDGIYDTPGPSQNWGWGGRASSPGGRGGDYGQPGDAGGTVDGAYNGTGYAGGAAGSSLKIGGALSYNSASVTFTNVSGVVRGPINTY